MPDASASPDLGTAPSTHKGWFFPERYLVDPTDFLRPAPGRASCAACGVCAFPEPDSLDIARCPLSACPKSLLNGPCGGMDQGRCEVLPHRACVHMRIRYLMLAEGRDTPGVIAPRAWVFEGTAYHE